MAALVRRGAWSAVDEVVSVSGGSITNAALAAAGTGSSDPSPGGPEATDDDASLEALAALHDRIRRDRARPFATARRGAAVASAVAAVAAAAALFVAAAGYGPVAIPRAPGLAALVALVPVTAILIRRLVQIAFADAATALALAPDAPRIPTGAPRHHVVCATGLDSGHPYRFSYGALPPAAGVLAAPRPAHVVRHTVALADAVVASVSLPGLAHRRTPAGLGGEILVDGGVSGVFGIAGPPDPHADGHEVLALDAARHLRTGGRLSRAARRVSLTARLARWLQVSLETSYLDDLAELPPERLVRICTPVVAVRDTPVERALARARAVTAGLGLRDLDDTHIRCALLAAYVGTLLVLDATDGGGSEGEAVPFGADVAWLAAVLGDAGLTGTWRDLLGGPPPPPAS
ncbi:MAG: hypothetical protein D6683_11370 [Actinomyces sp.]|nr:MAG: hypothetical protein D6683_11370 [Actinomyces sp.]